MSRQMWHKVSKLIEMNVKNMLRAFVSLFTACSLATWVFNKRKLNKIVKPRVDDKLPGKKSTFEMKEDPYSLEQLNTRLDRVNRWIENCDQKIYIMLAFIGACMAVFVSSSLFFKARSVLIQPFYAYLNNFEAFSFSLQNLLLFVGLLPICWYAGRMIFYLLEALFPKTISKEFQKENNTLEGDSLLHFNSIAEMKFDEFETKSASDSLERYKHDLISQIFINSKICTDKFEHLKKGLHAMNLLIIFVSIEAVLAFLLP